MTPLLSGLHPTYKLCLTAKLVHRCGFQIPTWPEAVWFALRQFPDGNCARARPRGFCLSLLYSFSLCSNKNIAPGFKSRRGIKQFMPLHLSLYKFKNPALAGSFNSYGEGGIWTLDTGINLYGGLANRCLQPLGHLSKKTNFNYDINIITNNEKLLLFFM